MHRHEQHTAQSCLLRVVQAAKSSTTNAHNQLDIIVVATAAERVTPSQLFCCLWAARAAAAGVQ